jgi:glycosyltransferase involved in cell wall biosynthesis
MASGTPVLTGQETAMAETAGDAAVKVDPFDVEQIADGMKSILCEAGLAADLRARGRARAAHYSWQRSAAMAAGLFEQMAREGHARRR